MKINKARPILYNFREYAGKKKGLFSIESPDGEYRLPGGWVMIEKEETIIGEDDDCYVMRLLATGHGEWVGDHVVQKKYILPIGIHKSRLVRWTGGQLELF